MLWLFMACDAVTLRANFADREPGLLYEAADLTVAPEELDQLVVLNYNIKYGGGRLIFFWECEGERYNMTETEVTTHLDNIASFITEVDPDILILQEVDRETRRSVYLDQVQYLLDRTPLNYGAYASQHRVDYLPTDGMGHVDFGNAILTRWPISQSTRVALPLVDAYPAYYRYLYLKRHVLLADIETAEVQAVRKEALAAGAKFTDVLAVTCDHSTSSTCADTRRRTVRLDAGCPVAWVGCASSPSD